jgi:hypothetical protein
MLSSSSTTPKKIGEALVTRYADKTILRKLNEEAERLGYNRQIISEGIDSLDPDTILAISPIMIHEHARGVRVDPHLRCSVRIVHPTSNAFNGLFLDVPMHLFELLPEKPEHKTATV